METFLAILAVLLLPHHLPATVSLFPGLGTDPPVWTYIMDSELGRRVDIGFDPYSRRETKLPSISSGISGPSYLD